MELPDPMARFAGLTPVVNHLKQAVVAESGRRGVGRIAVGAADHSHRQPIQLASNQTSVAMSIDVLVGDLLLGRGMVAAMTGVDQLIAKVLVIFVAAGHHDGVGTFTAVAGGSAHRGPVHQCFAEGGPRGKGCANRIARDLTEELRHEIPSWSVVVFSCTASLIIADLTPAAIIGAPPAVAPIVPSACPNQRSQAVTSDQPWFAEIGPDLAIRR
jgi:hypothetical protein